MHDDGCSQGQHCTDSKQDKDEDPSPYAGFRSTPDLVMVWTAKTNIFPSRDKQNGLSSNADVFSVELYPVIRNDKRDTHGRIRR
jgi:hypothetical protein